MKKILIVFILSFIVKLSFSQEFLGIKINGKKDDIVNAYKSKGFVITNISDDKNYVKMKGTVGGRTLELGIICTPKSKLVWKVSVYLPEQTSWYSLKSDYNEYLKILTEKYGDPKSKYDYFSKPYEEGDGYEMTGVSNEKCNYSAFWSDEIGIYISITKWKQVRISYENNQNSILDDKEKSEINKSIF